MNPRDRYCWLTLDEMEIKQGTDYDPSSQTVLSDATLPGSSGQANHALVVMLGGESHLCYCRILRGIVKYLSQFNVNELLITGDTDVFL